MATSPYKEAKRRVFPGYPVDQWLGSRHEQGLTWNLGKNGIFLATILYKEVKRRLQKLWHK